MGTQVFIDGTSRDKGRRGEKVSGHVKMVSSLSRAPKRCRNRETAGWAEGTESGAPPPTTRNSFRVSAVSSTGLAKHLKSRRKTTILLIQKRTPEATAGPQPGLKTSLATFSLELGASHRTSLLFQSCICEVSTVAFAWIPLWCPHEQQKQNMGKNFANYFDLQKSTSCRNTTM